jgi:sedoheptulose-bisphosphatase
MSVTNITTYLQSLITSDDRTELSTSVIPSLIGAISAISKAIAARHDVSQVGTANAFGDDQLNVDVEAESLIREFIARCPSIITASSEEDPVERPVKHRTDKTTSEKYTIAFDPLDGSSIIAPNWTVGTIIGIWDGTTALNQDPSSRQIASILGIYGPRTTVIVAIRLPGQTPILFEAGLGADSSLITLVRPEVRFAQPPYPTRYFAPANLRFASESKAYMDLITHYIKEKYTLRYAGGLVPDVVHMLVKGHGVYISPVGAGKAKLRSLYELCPIALVMECAGGMAVDPETGSPILSKPAADCDERGGLICGSVEDGRFAVDALTRASH